VDASENTGSPSDSFVVTLPECFLLSNPVAERANVVALRRRALALAILSVEQRSPSLG